MELYFTLSYISWRGNSLSAVLNLHCKKEPAAQDATKVIPNGI